MCDKYYVISTSEDGGVSLIAYSKQELLDRLTANDGDDEPEINADDCRTDKDLPMYDLAGRSRVFIIKGTIVVPKPKKTVVEYDIP